MSDKKAEAATAEAAAKDEKKPEDQKDGEGIAPVEEESIPLMGKDEFYPENHVEKVIADSTISRRNVAFYSCVGQMSNKRYNLHFLEDDLIIYTTGNTYQTFNLTTKEQKIYFSKDTDGIGSIAVHPSRQYFAVAEKGPWPNIYIYEYPSFKLYRILKKGTEMMYAHCEFSVSGGKLVSLGGAPDFTITVWDWVAQRIILKARAFQAEIFRASFSPYTDNVLFTAGNSHIRFWKMAQTFTGLKLQGEVGKFGQLELSDVYGYYELPDGKAVCGTEEGNMILWEGNLVKAHLVLDQPKDSTSKPKPLHEGTINLILFENDMFITVGADGFIKWWSLNEIDNAEMDETPHVPITSIKEIEVKTEDGIHACLVDMVKCDDFWLLQDANGFLWKLDCESQRSEQIKEFQSGSINEMALSDAYNLALTIGDDGTCRLQDFVRKKELYKRKFTGRGLCCDLLKRSEANKGRVAALGFSNGIVRIVALAETQMQLVCSFKAHDTAVVKVKYSPDQSMFVAASDQGELFFFEINGHSDISKYNPLCLIELPERTKITDLKWSNNSQKIICSCANGYVYELKKPDVSQVNNKESYLVENYPIVSWKIKMMDFQMKKNQKKDEEEEERKRRARLRGELPKEEEEEDEDWDPEPIHAVTYCNDDSGRFIVASEGNFTGYLYICDFMQERPLEVIAVTKGAQCQFIQYTSFGDIMIIGMSNGEIRLIAQNKSLIVKMHDGHHGAVTAARLSYDDKFLVSTGEDGLLITHTLDKYMINSEANYNPLEGVEGIDYMPDDQVEEIRNEKLAQFYEENLPNLPDIDVHLDGIDDSIFAISLKVPDDAQDIEDENIYSIQQAKLRTEEDLRMKLAEEKKQGVRGKIMTLRNTFNKLFEKNKEVDSWIQVSQDDFNIDPEYFEMLLQRNAAKIEETKKEVAWDIQYHTVALNKLKNKFYDMLDFEKSTVKAIKTHAYVTTFRVPKMSDTLKRNIEQFKTMLESEIAAKDGIDYEDEDMGDNFDMQADKKDERKDMNKSGTMNKTKTSQLASNIPQVKKTDAEKKREERKIQREARKKEIDALEKKEAMHSAEDPQERKDIEIAKATFGDFKLKLSSDYIVPETQQVNFNKKRQQMVLLEGSIHKLKVDFNTKIQELKVRKMDIIYRAEILNERLGQINTELGTPEELFVPTIDTAVEQPQKLFNITDKEIDEFRKEKLRREQEAIDKAKGKSTSKKKKEQQEREAAEALEAEQAAKDQEKNKEQISIKDQKVFERKGKKTHDTQLDDEYKMIRQIELQYEKDKIKKELDTLINNFDAEIKEMQKEKYRLESDLKNAEMKLILFFEELILLKSMETKDQELTKRHQSCRQEKGLILKEINEISKRLREKRKDIDKIKEREEDLYVKFHQLIPEGHEKYDEIRKFYEKITRKRRKTEKIEKDPDADEDDEDGAEEEEEVEEEEDDDDDDNNIAGLSQEDNRIDEVEKLRDERLELHDEKEKIQSFITDLDSQRKRLANNEQKIKMELEETEEEIQDFQKEKMAKLNQLDVSVVLKIKQIQNLVMNTEKLKHWEQMAQQELAAKEAEILNSKPDDPEAQELVEDARNLFQNREDDRGFFLSKDLNDSVLITRQQLQSLILRKKELDDQYIELERKYKEHKEEQVTHNKVIRENQKILKEAEREYQERQMLRFGNLVDLDSLEVSGPSHIVLELQNKFLKTSKRCFQAKEDAEADMQATLKELTKCVSKNTGLLNLIRELGENQLDLNKKLDSSNKAIFENEDNEERRMMQQIKEKYKEQLEVQAKEIEILKTEINLYKRKGGHIYTKVTTNRKVAHLQDN